MSAVVVRQLSRAEVALCMLSELGQHHDDVFRGHLPVLLLICVIKIDSRDELVHRHAHQVRLRNPKPWRTPVPSS